MKKITSYIPNLITCLNLLSGSVAVYFAFNLDAQIGSMSAMSWAFLFIAAAAVFDFCDGLSARLLHAYSPIGKELDSLSDLVSFGLAPAFLVMNTMLANGSPIWVSAFALLIAVMGAFRLAKFNVDTRQSTSFIGLPIPANAIFWIGALQQITTSGYPGDATLCILILVLSLLMVSEIKMFSLKFANLSFLKNYHRYILVIASIASVVLLGIQGLALAIIIYVVMSLFVKSPSAPAAK